MKRSFIPLLVLMLFLMGCQSEPAEINVEPQAAETVLDPDIAERHNASIPDVYAEASHPITVEAIDEALASELYGLHCSACHGDGGMGDGPAGQVLDPPATPIAHTSQLVGDDYLFWRISEGGSSFGTGMPAWKGTLTDLEIWGLIDYLRGFEQAQGQPHSLAASDAN